MAERVCATGTAAAMGACRWPIAQLPQVVIDLIAAGEVVQRPCSVVKELMENSLDAGATQISITIADGGLKSIHMQDNGSGIARCDLRLLCARHATSKLRTQEQLRQLRTYGFRGEALAAASNVARVTVVTKTAHEQCAFSATYKEGVLDGEPRPTAGNGGTLLIVEDLFYNVPQRRLALRYAADEYNKIASIVWWYAVHNAHVGFTLKKSNGGCDVKTTGLGTNRRVLAVKYGEQFANELVELHDEEPALGYELRRAFVSRPEQKTVRSYTFVLFVNDRLVENGTMKHSIRRLVDDLFDKQSAGAFVYVDLHVAPQNIDVNVHPSKEEVIFLNEGEIIERIQRTIQQGLADLCRSRPVHTKLPAAGANTSNVSASVPRTGGYATPKLGDDAMSMKRPLSSISNRSSFERSWLGAAAGGTATASMSKRPAAVHESRLVRTDEKQRKIDLFVQHTPPNRSYCTEQPVAKMVSPQATPPVAERAVSSAHVGAPVAAQVPSPLVDHSALVHGQVAQASASSAAHDSPVTDDERLSDARAGCSEEHGKASTSAATPVTPESIRSMYAGDATAWWRDIEFPAVVQLRARVAHTAHEELTRLIRTSVFVGTTDNLQQAMVQSGDQLLCVQLKPVLTELFYQLLTFRMGNFSVLKLSQPLDINALLSMVGASMSACQAAAVDSNSDTLDDLFSIEMTSSCLSALPHLVSDWTDVPLAALPQLVDGLLRTLTSHCNDDLALIDRLCRHVSEFYASVIDCTTPETKALIANVLWPAVKSKLLVPHTMAGTDGADLIKRLIDIHTIYTVFDRC